MTAEQVQDMVKYHVHGKCMQRDLPYSTPAFYTVPPDPPKALGRRRIWRPVCAVMQHIGSHLGPEVDSLVREII